MPFLEIEDPEPEPFSSESGLSSLVGSFMRPAGSRKFGWKPLKSSSCTQTPIRDEKPILEDIKAQIRDDPAQERPEILIEQNVTERNLIAKLRQERHGKPPTERAETEVLIELLERRITRRVARLRQNVQVTA